MAQDPSRRDALKGLAAAFIAVPALGAAAPEGCEGGDPTPGEFCSLTPEQTEGPYYLDLADLRQDITEGRPGVPLMVTLRVVNAETCEPIPDVVVDLWSTDALGLYSGFPGQGDSGDIDTTGETFMRGSQVTNGEGEVEFVAIYPSWYPGRTIHSHFKVHLSSRLEVASQLYYPDDISDMVMDESPYNTRGERDTTNNTDGILRTTPNGERLIATVASEGAGYRATLVIGVSL